MIGGLPMANDLDFECDYDAITIDTSVLEGRDGVFLDSGYAKRLEQFKDSPFRLVLSEVIYNEIRAHVKAQILKARSSLKKAFNELQRYKALTNGDIARIKHIMVNATDADEIAHEIMSDFVDRCGIEVISACDHVELRRVLDSYFNHDAPFAVEGKKKHEFPDAIALMSLQAWADKNDIQLIAASKDTDWVRFCSNIDEIDVVVDLGEALSSFQRHHAALAFCEQLSTRILLEGPNEVSSAIDRALADKSPSSVWNIDACSSMYYEEENAEVTYDNFSYLETDDRVEIRLIEVGDHYLVAEVPITIEATATGDFIFQAKDEGEYITVGSSSETIHFTHETEAMVKISNYSTVEFSVLEVDFSDLVHSVDFGDIEPDWDDDYYE